MKKNKQTKNQKKKRKRNQNIYIEMEPEWKVKKMMQNENGKSNELSYVKRVCIMSYQIWTNSRGFIITI